MAALVEDNLALVHWCVKRFLPPAAIAAIGYDDLVSVGNIALVKAAQYFDPAMGFRFTTFATHSIRRLLWQARDKSVRQPNFFQWSEGIDGSDGGSLVPDHRKGLTDEMVDLEQIERVLSRLTPRHREIVEAFYLQRENMQDIASRVGLTRSRIEQIIKNSIANLRGEPLVRKRRKPIK